MPRVAFCPGGIRNQRLTDLRPIKIILYRGSAAIPARLQGKTSWTSNVPEDPTEGLNQAQVSPPISRQGKARILKSPRLAHTPSLARI